MTVAAAEPSVSSAAPAFDAEIAIVGAGPVGLTLALDLAARGRRIVVLETRRRGEPPSVKCNHVAARTMEQFRRLGVAADVRAAGLPPDYPNDVVFRTSVTGTELARIHIPARATRYSDTSGPDGWWPTPEPPHRINQIYLEPILFAHAEAKARRDDPRSPRGHRVRAGRRRRQRRTRAISTAAPSGASGRASWSAATAAARW